MLVVSDTSPLRGLHSIGRIELLQLLFADVIIPPAVDRELRNPPAGAAPLLIERTSFIRVVAPSKIEDDTLDLDAGEREAISLARELTADWLLIDERAGHAVAQRLGIRVIGVLGVLLEAKNAQDVTLVRPLMDQLRQSRFFIAKPVYDAILRQAGE